MFRIAAVSFLNTIPLIAGLEPREGRDVTLCRDLPSRLHAGLLDGSADVALLPVADVLRGPVGGILPVGAIACHGPVDSVKVFAASAPGELRRIAADRASHTSVALLRVLLAERHGLVPDVTEVEPGPGVVPGPGEGLLIIGDRCFAYERFLRESGRDDVRGWDLGELWRELTGLPFVFAVWALAPGFPAERGEAAVADLRGILVESLEHGLARRTLLAEREAAAGRLGPGGRAGAAAIDYYFRHSLRFTVGPEELAGIRRFHELAVRHRILPGGPMPPVL